MKFFVLLFAIFISLSSFASISNVFCGVKRGSFGNAFLYDNGENDPAGTPQMILVLAEQGGDQSLFEAADDIILERTQYEGMQNGSRYCVEISTDDNGVESVIEAWASPICELK